MLKHIGTQLVTEKELDEAIKELNGIGYTTDVKSLGKFEESEELKELMKTEEAIKNLLTLEDIEKLKEIEFYSRRLKRAIVPEESKQPQNNKSGNEETKKEIDALGRMMINLEDIKEFYTWSQKQAKASFILAVSMCISGFVLMVVAILLPVVFRLSFQMSIIPAVGGAITEVIAGTALIVYRNSLSQLNHYHKALHEDERFLSSVNLLGKFSTVEARDDMLREIIRSEIQMNLAVIHENVKSDSSSIKENSKK